MSNLDSGLDRDVDITPALDLDLIERDLRDVETTLARLADGTYFAEGRASVPGTDARPSPTDSGLEP